MFIVFERIDGCGKSTQLFKLAEYLYSLSKYCHILITREAYKDRKIRELLKQEESNNKKISLTELFIQDRKEHIQDLILPNLKKNIIVISDRYKYSTICFQAAQGQGMNHLIEMQKDMPVPDLTFILDVPSEIAFNRISKRTNHKEQNKFEEDIFFLEKVRKNYLKMPEIFPNEKIIIINGNNSVEEIFEDIRQHLKTPQT